MFIKCIKNLTFCLTAILLIIVLNGCDYFWPNDSANELTLPPKLIKNESEYNTITVSLGEVEKSRFLYSKFVYAQSATFTADKLTLPDWAAGQINIIEKPDVFFKLGDKVKKGQKIAQAYTDIDNIISQYSQAQGDRAKNYLNILKQLKASFTFIAPFDGVIVNEKLNSTGTVDGEYPSVIELADPNKFYLACPVAEDQYGLFSSGEKGMIIIDTSNPEDPNHGKDIRYNGVVVNVPKPEPTEANVIQFQGSNNYLFKISDDYDINSVKVGTMATFKIVTDQKKNVINIPSSAVRYFASRSLVGVIENGFKVDRQITIGFIGDDNLEVLKGLEVGDVVILN